MDPMERVTFVKGLFCGILITVLGAALAQVGHHSSANEPGDREPVAEMPADPPTTTAAVPLVAVTPNVTPKPAEKKSSELTWTNFDGTGDSGRAVLMFDGKSLGSGEDGLVSLRESIARLPAGSTVRVHPVYSTEPAEGVRRHYPFDTEQLKNYAEYHHVALTFATGG